jgi:hypothetical protein
VAVGSISQHLPATKFMIQVANRPGRLEEAAAITETFLLSFDEVLSRSSDVALALINRVRRQERSRKAAPRDGAPLRRPHPVERHPIPKRDRLRRLRV